MAPAQEQTQAAPEQHQSKTVQNTAQQQPNPEQVNKMAQGTAQEAAGDVEEFDYSDFENEDA